MYVLIQTHAKSITPSWIPTVNVMELQRQANIVMGIYRITPHVPKIKNSTVHVIAVMASIVQLIKRV